MMKLTKEGVERRKAYCDSLTAECELGDFCIDWLAMRKMLEKVQWVEGSTGGWCPSCYSMQTAGHESDCKLKGLLR